MEESSFVLGPAVGEFESAFADFLRTPHVIGVGSGFDALRLALQALAIGPGDEVILPANTYIATALAVSAAGARPVLVDCLPDTFAVDPDLIDAAVTSNTRAIIPVHLTGQAAPMEPIAHIAARHSLHVIEDAAQAHGTAYMGAMCGSLGEIGCFSFYPGKNLGGYGDGGAVATNDHHLAERLRELRNYGQHAKYYHVVKGFNSRLDSIQAAVLKVKLAKLSEWNEQRAHNATLYHELLRGVGDVAFQRQASESTHNYHLFIVTTAYRDLLRNHLGAAGIETGIHYPLPIHLQPAYADLNYIHGQFPQAERLAKEMLSLPMYPELLPSEINYVAYSIKDFFARLEGLVP